MNPAELASLISASITAFLVLIFVRAAWHKLTGFTEFTGFVADYRLVPEPLVQPASIAIVAAELGMAALQLIPGGQVPGLLLAIVMLGTYAAGMAINIRRGRSFIECGCGGAVQPLGWPLVLRNLVLMTLGLIAIATAPFGLDLGGAATAIAAGFLFWLVFLLAEHVLTNFSTARLTR